MNNKHRAVTLAALALAAMQLQAVTPLWMRDVKISPNGKEIAFTYRGDVYKVGVDGGRATRLTSQPSYESNPVWSPDGAKIAFSSDRHGNFDIFIMNATGGQAKRLTSNSSNEIAEAFTPDGTAVLFSASIQDPAKSAMHPSARMTELYRVPVNGGIVKQVLGTPAQMPAFGPEGKWMVYQDIKGFEDEWRKHHTSSVTRDIWRYDFSTGKHTNLTSRSGEDRNPLVSPDGKTIFLLSERDGGTMNLYSFPVDNPSAATRLTEFTTHPVRFLSGASDGTLAMAYDGEIYIKRSNSAPQKVNIEIVEDWGEPIKKLPIKRGTSSLAVAPDGKSLVLTARGEVFATSVEYPTTRQVSVTPQAESHVSWGPDARSIVYASDRSGLNNIYQATLARKEDPDFPNATKITEVALFADDGVERTQPQYSPDGSKLAFIQDRNRLMVMDVNSKSVKQLTDSTMTPRRSGKVNYSWSPDGEWIVMEAVMNGRDPYTDIALINVASGKVTDLTHSGYFDEMPRWAMDGQAILFLSERYGMRNHASWGSQYDAMLLFLNQDAFDRYNLSEQDYAIKKEAEKAAKKKPASTTNAKNKSKKKGVKDGAASDGNDENKVKKSIVELDGLDSRLVRLTPASSPMSDAYITPDGETLYYLTEFEKGLDLWKISLRKHEAKLVGKVGDDARLLLPDSEGKNLFIAGPSTIKKMELKGEKISPVTYNAVMKLDAAAEREYMFNDAYLQERERFYDKNMHGVDWDGMTAAYRRFLPHIDNNYDFAELLSEWLGELNVSHTGGRYRPATTGADRTASLGLLYDWDYEGPGLKIVEIVAGGPFATATTKVKPGDVIESVNSEVLAGDTDYATLFTDLAGKKTLIGLYDPSNDKRWEEVVIPVGSGKMSDLLYERWVKARAADVDRWSNGRLGYVHISSMDDESFRRAYSEILGRYNNREGMVVDIRWNGGGRLHEDIEVLLSGEKYLTQVIRGQDVCDMPSRRWNKPSVMLMSEACYSNAHGTPWVYKHKGIGKLVGMPVPGTMTSVNWVTMQDPTMVYGIPVIGYRTAEGNYLENFQLEPDVKIANSPETIVTGEDEQLRRAVTELLKELPQK